ncbi:1-acyl-sn-glycerol-3-phosphate acyltransferase [Carboxylicivirga sp. N1Y90]|uniref:1-acyl-sn-glycerol-3-phosphate acyltransferase n=1 Tax=Carboxylicivirga fragile TaxID=3417571 RepID=UPI003D32CA93|nr:1-acyl-sn-glycerol-3-phosphate acyltransferase [Marinilabiliaceae bacterium N1Y90]
MIDLDRKLVEMRPYNDIEVQEAMIRLLKHKEFEQILKYVFPNQDIDISLEQMRNVKSTNDFQRIFSSSAVEEILNKTASCFSFSGLENLRNDSSYLFISNHRDIVMDSAILQNVLLTNGHRTTQITFGSNLMSNQFIIDIGKINKMFTFYRGGSRNDIYYNALAHSLYIKKVLTEEDQSIWIAQRDGRTKNGNDKTQLSLLKMLTIKQKDPIKAIKQFNIVPVSISYELEPCDILKVNESIISEKGSYAKKKDEDFNSVLTGITGKKGKIHLAFGEPINSFIDANADTLTACNIHENVCKEMDRQIYLNYKLNPINYVCYDIISYIDSGLNVTYNETDIKETRALIDRKANELSAINKNMAKQKLYEMYAAPVRNYLNQK